MKPYSLLIGSILLLATLTVQADDKQSTEARLREALKNMAQQLRAAQDQVATAQAAQAESDRQLGLAKDQVSSLTTEIKNVKDKSAADHELAERVFEAYKERNTLLEGVVEDRERKNFELYKTCLEVLDRYQKYSLGEALEAKEPFFGQTKVALENQVQDYAKKFMENKTFPGQPVTPVDPAAKPDGADLPKSDAPASKPSPVQAQTASPAVSNTPDPAKPATPTSIKYNPSSNSTSSKH